MERDHKSKPYSVIMGKLKDDDAMTEQAYRYPKDAWTPAEAKAHCTAHKGISFEPASGDKPQHAEMTAESLGNSRLLEIMNGPWAILPAYLEEIQSIYLTHLRGDKINLKDVEAAIGKPLNNEPKPYEVANGLAVIPIEGVIARKMNLLTAISGGVSTQAITRDYNAAVKDPAVDCIMLYLDTPGGEAMGIQDLARTIYQGRAVKPIIAFTDGLMASAGYWIGAAAHRVYISGNDTQVGSIGVVANHVDVSKMEEMKGVKTTEIYAGKYKRIASQYGPLSEEGRQTIQDRVDQLYSMFTDDVAAYRPDLSTDDLTTWADGKIFMGASAKKAGLVDGVSTRQRLMTRLMKDKGNFMLRESVEAEIEQRRAQHA